MKSVLPLGNFRRFKSKAEAADYILHRIGFAGSRVWDITWADPLDRGFTFDEKERRRYFNRIERASSKNLTYRELMMFCGLEERTRKARRLIERTGKGYELKAIPDLPEGPPHRWQFVIVDDEVILDTFATDQEDIVEYFCRYYESQWASAKPIRLGDAGGIDRLEQFLDEHVRFADDESTDRADKEYVDDSISIDTELAS